MKIYQNLISIIEDHADEITNDLVKSFVKGRRPGTTEISQGKGDRFICLFCSVSLVHKIPPALQFSSRSHPQPWHCQSTVPVVAIDELE